MSDGIHRTLIKEEKPDHGLFVVREELWQNELVDKPLKMRSAYALDGTYISSMDDDNGIISVILENEIVPQRRGATHNVCSIGKSRANGKWYGWSHRAYHGFNSKQKAQRFAESVAHYEQAAIVHGTHLHIKVAPKESVLLKKIMTSQGMPPVAGLHATLFETNLPGFDIKVEPNHVTIKSSEYLVSRFGQRQTTLALVFRASSLNPRRSKLLEREKSFAAKRGYVLEQPAFIAHVTLTEGLSPTWTPQDSAKLTAKIRAEVGDINLIGEHVNPLNLPVHRFPVKIVIENSPAANRQRLKENASMTTPVRIVPNRVITDPMTECSPDVLQTKLDSYYSQRTVAALVGQGQRVQQINKWIRLLRASNNLPEDVTTRPIYVGHDSNIDPRGGMLTEQASETYDLNWAARETARGLASVSASLVNAGYVASRRVQDAVKIYEFANGSTTWTFVLSENASWCFDVAKNGVGLTTFNVRPNATVDQKGIPESMLASDWNGHFEPIEAERYKLAWKNVANLIASSL